MRDLREAVGALLAQVGDSLPHAKQEIEDVREALAEARGEPVACADCTAGHPRYFVPENGETIHTLPGGAVNFCVKTHPPAAERGGGAVAWAARDGFGKIVVLRDTERRAKADSVRRALEVGGGPLPVFPLYAHPPAAERGGEGAVEWPDPHPAKEPPPARVDAEREVIEDAMMWHYGRWDAEAAKRLDKSVEALIARRAGRHA